MPEPTTPILHIVPLGLERRLLAMLELALQDTTRRWCQLSDDASADVALLDGDAPGALVLFDQTRQRHPQRPIVVLSVREVRLKQAIPLKKPFRIDELLAVLERLRPQRPGQALQECERRDVTATPLPGVRTRVAPTPHHTQDAAQALQSEQLHELCGNAADVDLGHPRQVASVCYDPGHHLQGLLARALADGRRLGRAVRLQVPVASRTLELLPAQRLYRCALSDRQLRGICIMPLLGPHRWEALSAHEAQALLELPDAGQPLASLETLLWKVALWTARGRLPVGTDPQQPMRLRFWPNLTRLPLTPHALRIAALWEHAPVSLAETVARLAIPQRYVFAFYSACHAIGAVECAMAAANTAAITAPVPTAHRGLLQRILNVLRGAA
ncbi:MAG TPA: hypothetical protein VNN09_10840 [Candidatus Competibacteraceae bacterium]|nr:hypothetical protein [Candidatus Competibacteraceae bacterium]